METKLSILLNTPTQEQHSIRMGALPPPKRIQQKSPDVPYPASKRYIQFNKLSISKCNFLFDALFAPVLLYSSEVWGAYDSLNLKEWEKDPIERFHSQFYKSYLGLNRRAPNVAARNETGRLPLKLIVFSNIIKFWLHLLKLPSSSVAGQCLQISTQLADSGKKSFMLTMYDMLKQYSNSFTPISKL